MDYSDAAPTTDASSDDDYDVDEPVASTSYPHAFHDPDYDDDDDPPAGFATQTAFDNYFLQAAKPARTSANVFSARVPPLAPAAYAAALARAPAPAPRPRPAPAQCARWRAELAAGFNLLFYGAGSKRAPLAALARALAARGAHVVVAHAFRPAFALAHLLDALERVPAVAARPPAAAPGVDAQVQRIYDAFSVSGAGEGEGGIEGGDGEPAALGARHVVVVVHNLDAPALRGARAQAALARLAAAPRLHVVASLDRLAGAGALRWTLGEVLARTDARVGAAPRRGFAWLWHDLTTLAPYDAELAGADPGSFAGAAGVRGARAPAPAAAAGAAVGESAARHVLAAVTQKARRLFALLGAKQLALMGDEGAGAGGAEKGAFDYAQLFSAARDEFIATNDTALRALLGEFRDHGLVVPVAGPGGEALWIPMRRDALTKILGELQAEQA